MTDAERLASIRARLAAIAPGDWSRVHDGEGELVEARGPMGELLPVLRFHPGASVDERLFVADAPATVRFLLGLVERAIAFASRVASRPSDADPPAGRANGPDARSGSRSSTGRKDFAAEAAMKCAEPAFKRFLIERHGLESPASDERTAQKLRSILGVTSRRELNDDAAAAGRWVDLRGAFETWKRAG